MPDERIPLEQLAMVPNASDAFPDEPPYEGITNAFGQYGVSEVSADVIGESAGNATEGDPCVFIYTSMCETTLSIAGAEELIRRLRAAIAEATGKPLSDPDAKRLGPFARASETSRQAALAAYPRQGTQRRRIVEALLERDRTTRPGTPRGLTRDELASLLNMSPNTVRPRVVELIAGGWCEESAFTRKTIYGNDAALIVATQRPAS